MFRTVLEKIHPAVFLKAAQSEFANVSDQQSKFVEVCSLSVEESLRLYEVSESGLTPEQVEAQQERFGPNDLGPKKKVGLVSELFERCRNPLVIQLLIICLVSLLMGDYRSGIVVGGMIVLSVILAYIQENRSSKAIEELQAMVSANCMVIRNGKEEEIPISEIVPGDIVALQAGSLIPADVRLISAKVSKASRAHSCYLRLSW